MRLIFSFLITLLLSLPVLGAEIPAQWDGPYVLSMSKQNPAIENNLYLRLQSLGEGERTSVWVFFTDKGIDDRAELYSRLSEYETRLTARALKRRMKSRGEGNLVDFRDLPVHREYVDMVLSSGAELRHILKWFNAVTVTATRDQISAISNLPFVRLIMPVAFTRTDTDLDFTPIQPDMTTVTLSYGASFGQLDQINAVAAHELGFKGQGIIICMMDTGYRQSHQAFQNIINDGRLLAQYDFINHDDNTDYESGQDHENQPNHGTVTWSTLGGESDGFHAPG